MMANRTIHALLVEDNPVETRLLYKRVTEVPSVEFTWENVLKLEEAKNLLRVEPFDLILLDLSLPDSQGLDTFIHLYPHALCLPIVILTEHDDELLALQAVRSGAQDYLVKGQLEPEPLVRTLCYAIERKRAETALRVRNQQLQVLTEQLWPKAKFSGSMEDLAERFVYELNNPLAKISVRLDELLEQFDSDDPRRSSLQAIQSEIDRMGRLVGGSLQTSLEDMGGRKVAPRETLEDFLLEGAVGRPSDEASFFEALGSWVLDYMTRHTRLTSRSINTYLRRVKKSPSAGFEALSQREHEVVQLVAKGLTNKEIARQLSLSVRTVERYSSSVMKKLGLQNRAELIRYAVRQGIVNGDDVAGSAHTAAEG
jgi:DNA-binding NarL/FixJ family response regulator